MLITGVSPAGIGYTTAAAIASQDPATLILASRTLSKLKTAASDITAKYPNTNIKIITLDLSSLDSVKHAAREVAKTITHLDILINNAGISTFTRASQSAPDGTILDNQLFTNYLGPFLLTHLLLPLLRAAKHPSTTTRIVNLSSHGHRLSPIRFSDLALAKPDIYDVPSAEQPSRTAPPMLTRQGDDGYAGFLGYGQSKTANILHAYELSRRLRREGIVALSVHPGTIATELSRGLDEQGKVDINSTAPNGLWKSQDAGCATTLVAAFDPKLGGLDLGGEVVGYMADCQLADGLAAAHAKDTGVAKWLWEVSERMLRIDMGI